MYEQRSSLEGLPLRSATDLPCTEYDLYCAGTWMWTTMWAWRRQGGTARVATGRWPPGRVLRARRCGQLAEKWCIVALAGRRTAGAGLAARRCPFPIPPLVSWAHSNSSIKTHATLPLPHPHPSPSPGPQQAQAAAGAGGVRRCRRRRRAGGHGAARSGAPHTPAGSGAGAGHLEQA